MAKYPVKRGNRFDSIHAVIVHEYILAGLMSVAGAKEGDNVLDYSPEFAVAMHANKEMNEYARFVIYAVESKDNKRPQLATTSGERFRLPGKDDSKESLAEGFVKWLQIDEFVMLEINESITEANKPPTPRHTLPADQLTEEEKADPN